MALLWAPVVAAYLTLLSTVWGCGVPAIKPNVKIEGQIINGVNEVPGSWPWQVSLQIDGFHICGGSLINQNWVVTAAHCKGDPAKHRVVLGEYDRTSNAEPVQVKTIAKVITYPYYDLITDENDIQLLKLSSPAKLNSRVSPICLPSATDNPPPGLNCVVTGWGRTNPNIKEGATKLQQVVLPLMSNSECQRHWKPKITSNMICAGGKGTSACKGDSGGPLMCLKGSTWSLVGIVSFGISTCDIRVPSIFTRVSKFTSWINEVISKY